MYEFSGKLKMVAIVLMVLGALGLGYGFLTGSNNSVEDAKEAIAHHEAEQHDAQHQEGETAHHEASHDEHADSHDEHAVDPVAHAQSQMNNRPWAAVYVPLFFFFMIALSIFVFYAMQIGASA